MVLHTPCLHSGVALRVGVQVKGAARPAHVAAALMDLEAVLRRSVFAPDWDAPPAGAALARTISQLNNGQAMLGAFTLLHRLQAV